MLLVCGRYRYRISNKENVLPLSIPLDQAENKAEVEAFEEREQKRQRTADAATVCQVCLLELEPSY